MRTLVVVVAVPLADDEHPGELARKITGRLDGAEADAANWRLGEASYEVLDVTSTVRNAP